MLVRVDPAQADAFVDFMWERRFLVVPEGRGLVRVVPIGHWLPLTARAMLKRALSAWRDGARPAEIVG